MDQVGNICRCLCHVIFCGDSPEWKCYCNCGIGWRSNVDAQDNKMNMSNIQPSAFCVHMVPRGTICYVCDERDDRITRDQMRVVFERLQKLEKSDHDERIKDIEYRLKHIVELPTELDCRLQDVERILGKLESRQNPEQYNAVERKPHKCPVCGGTTYNDKDDFCSACEGSGIIWEEHV